MLKKSINVGISLSLLLSLASCSNSLSQLNVQKKVEVVPVQTQIKEVSQPVSLYNNTVVNTPVVETKTNVVTDSAVLNDAPVNLTVQEIEDNEMSIKVSADKTIEASDFTSTELLNMAKTDSYPFLLDVDNNFSTQGIFANAVDKVKTFYNKIKDKVNKWKQDKAAGKFDKFQKFEETNPAFAKELIDAAKLTGTERRTKLNDIKAKYPDDYKGLKNKLAIYRWMQLEKKYPGLATDMMDLSQLPVEQKDARLAEIKAKYPKFFAL